MDVFEYRSSRSFSTNGIFVTNDTNTEMSGLFVRLKNVMFSELHLQWDVAFLEQYVMENMVPRGLRWDVQPQQGETDLATWCEYFNKAGLKLIEFLVERKKARLPALDKEIKDLRDKLMPSSSTPEYTTLSSNLKTLLEKEERDQKNKKQKKYSRDVSDYKSNLVFNWQKKLSAPNDSGASAPPMELSQPIAPHPDRRLVYDPPPPPPPPLRYTDNRGSNSTPKRSSQSYHHYSDQGRGRLPSNAKTTNQKGRNQRGPNPREPYYAYPIEGSFRPNDRSGYEQRGYSYGTPPHHRDNRYVALRNEEPYGGQYEQYSQSDGFGRSPYYQPYSGSSQASGFHMPIPNPPRSPKPKEALEGGGTYKGKRKRTQ